MSTDSIIFRNGPIFDKNGRRRHEYAEHRFIGDQINLRFNNNDPPTPAHSRKFNLPNGVNVTYGQISALAGDFYGTWDPISDGKDEEECSKRFQAAYDTLAKDSSRQPKEANSILEVVSGEISAVNRATRLGFNPSVAYSTLIDLNPNLWLTTSDRPKNFPNFVQLAEINWDHFGEDAVKAYKTGHASAIRKAVSQDLEGAYVMNAFTDHFLQDLFAAGHLRTPRRRLSGSSTANYCAKYMHDEDNAIGLKVKNLDGKSWTCYGDKSSLNEAARDNLQYCITAVQASADEIYTAYSTRQTPSTYAALMHVPTLESARSADQKLVELFTLDGKRRSDIKNRRAREFTKSWMFLTTFWSCYWSGWWDYPITMDGPQAVIPWSGISVASPRIWSLGLFYQSPINGAIVRKVHLDGKWGSNEVILRSTVRFTPLASIDWKDGKEIRVYYLDYGYILQEHCYSSDKGWFTGGIGELNIQASANAGIGAIQFNDGGNIRVYYQKEDGVIGELCKDGNNNWRTGTLDIRGTLDGTSIAATVYKQNSQTKIRVYYQAGDKYLKEYCYDGDRWYIGDWNPGEVLGRNPIGAVAFTLDNGDSKIQVYWRNNEEKIVTSTRTGSWGPVTEVIKGITSGFKFTVLQWKTGQHIRLYYQNGASALLEHCSDNGGNTWFPGSLEVK